MAFRALLLLGCVATMGLVVNVTAAVPMLVVNLNKEAMDVYVAGVIEEEMGRLAAMKLVLDDSFNKCEIKMNSTLAECNTCVTKQCQGTTPPSPDLGDTILAVLKSPDTLLNGPVDAIAKLTSSLSIPAKKKIENTISNVVNAVSGNAKTELLAIVSKLEKAGQSVLSKTKSIVLGIGTKASSIWNTIESGTKKAAETAGNAILNAGKDIFNKLKDVFSGRRRRSTNIDAKTLQCYNKCASCKMHTLATAAEKMELVCGKTLNENNSTAAKHADMIVFISNSLRSGKLINVQYTFADVDMVSYIVKNPTVTGSLENSQSFTYKSNTPLNIASLTNEVYNKDVTEKFLSEFFGRFENAYKKQ